jgi:CRP-like cAMP-binding protein
MENQAKNLSCDLCSAHCKSIFRYLDKEKIQKLSAQKVMNTYKKGTTLFHQGNKAFGVHCLASGKIKISSLTDDGKENVMSIATAGDALGHRNIYGDKDYTSTAVALEDSKICFIESRNIIELLESDSSFSKGLFERMSHEINSIERRELSLMYKSVRVRVAQLLIWLAKDFGKDVSGKLKLDLVLSRSEMASMVGIASETLIRLLTELKQEGIIEQQGKALYILAPDELREQTYE